MSIAYKKNGVWVTASGTPPIDDALSATSENAVQNKIVKAAIENSASTLQQNFQAGVDDIYDAVVAKGSTPASKSLSDVVAGIGDIPTGIQPSGSISISQNGSVDVTNYATADVSVPTPTGNASEGDVLAPKTFSNSSGANKTGTMTNRGAVSQTLNTSTTSYTIPAGYHNGSGTVSITTQEKSCTPSTSAQNITPDSGKVLSKVAVSAIQTETKTVTPSRSNQTITPTSGKYLTSVTVKNARVYTINLILSVSAGKSSSTKTIKGPFVDTWIWYAGNLKSTSGTATVTLTCKQNGTTTTVDTFSITTNGMSANNHFVLTNTTGDIEVTLSSNTNTVNGTLYFYGAVSN